MIFNSSRDCKLGLAIQNKNLPEIRKVFTYYFKKLNCLSNKKLTYKN